MVPPGTGDWGEPAISPTGRRCPTPSAWPRPSRCCRQAGFGPDNPLKLELSYNTSENHKRIAVAIQSMWKQLGVQAELVNREVKVHYDVLKENQFDVARAAWVADYNDPQDFLYLLETRPACRTTAATAIPSSTADGGAGPGARPEAALDIMQQAERIAMTEDAWLPIYYYVSKNLVSQKVKGYVDNTKDIHRPASSLSAGSRSRR